MVIIKVPGINGLGKTKGCENAPEIILDTLKNEIYSNISGSINFSKLKIENIELDNSNLESTEKIYRKAFDSFKKNKKSIFLGGDHSVSYHLTRGFFDYCQDSGKEPCLIVFDAHPDLMPPMEFPTHEEWLRQLIEDGFPVENILFVGVRNYDREESRYFKQKGIRAISINKLTGDLENQCDSIMEFSNGKELYVSLDIDVVDPAFAPGTGYQEPGGLSSREILYIFQRINKVKNLKGVDIVEINPEKDKDKSTIKLGAKILSELI